MSFEQFSVIESTLREGEQFSTATFSTDEKLEIVRLLNEFGAEMIELTSPLASPQSEADVRAITRMVRAEKMQTRILTHIRCKREDAVRALDTGVHGVDVVIGTSPQLMQHSHGKSIRQVIDAAGEVLSYIREQAPDVVLRFSTEDSFRSRPADLYRVYLAVADLGLVNRLGVADTVGVALPSQVSALVGQLVKLTGLDIEFHGHNDSGCAIANACAALEAGATHIDTTILGIGERNGITSLGGLVARMYVHDKESVRSKYNLPMLREVENFVAGLVEVDVPFNNYITGFTAFTHKAGIHAKAILNNPSTYEILDPADFGLTRYIHVAHRLTGWNAIKERAEQLQLELGDDAVKKVTAQIKAMADQKRLTLDDVDYLLRAYHSSVVDGEAIEAMETVE